MRLAGRLDLFQALVGGTIVDKEHAGFAKGRGQVFFQFPAEGIHAVFFIEDGDDNGEFVVLCLVHRAKTANRPWRDEFNPNRFRPGEPDGSV